MHRSPPLLPALALLAACGPPPRKPAAPAAPPAALVATPAPVDPQLVALEGALGNRYLETDRAAEVVAHLRITTRDLTAGPRPALNLALAIDTSGSMTGPAIEAARAAALSIVDRLQPGDRLSVVVFHSQTEVLLPVTPIEAANLGPIRDRIAAMKATGTTDLAGGLTTAINLAAAARLPDGVNRVVLLSDGVPNDPSGVPALAQAARASGLAITALGLGLEYDETLLAQLAQGSGGSFHFVEQPAEVERVFREEVVRMQRVVARDLSLALVPGPGVDIREVVGVPAAAYGPRGRALQLGELSQGQELDLVVRLAVTGHRADATVELLDATLQFVDAVAGAGSCRRSLFLAATATGDPARLREGADPAVLRRAASAVLAAATVQAIAYARGGDLPAAGAALDRAEPEARAAADALDAPELRAAVAELAELRRSLPALLPPPPPPTADYTPTAADAVLADVPATAPATIRRSHSRANDAFQPRARGGD